MTVPAWFAEALVRARALAAGELQPAVPRDAATVVLLRDSEHGLQVHLLRRVGSMVFAAGMHVFPGGGVDERDAAADIEWVGAPPQDWVAPLSARDARHAQAIVSTAVRETFEECGVLLAGTAGAPVADVSGDEWEAERVALESRGRALHEVLSDRGLALRADLLRPWAHWITPEVEPRRYDTRFLVAALPAEQRTRHVGGESEVSAWVSPGEAVQRQLSGEMAMLPPTVSVLRDLSELSSVAAVLQAAEGRTVTPVLPRIVADPDGPGGRILMPGDPGYLTDED